MRSTRNQPFCWQEKKINRLLRERFEKSERVKMLLLYATLTEMDSDFNSKDIKYYTRSIADYSGLGKEFIPKGLKILENLKVLRLVEEREAGRFKGKRLIYTPEKVKERPKVKNKKRTVHRKTSIGRPDTSEDSLLIEDSPYKEDSKKDAIAFSPSLRKKKRNIPKIDLVVEGLVSLYQEKIFPSMVTQKGKQFIRARLENYTEEDLRDGIDRFSKNEWRMEKNSRNGIEWFFRDDDQIEKWIGLNLEKNREVIKI